jgi:DNA-3-methyladenine glycosylase II
VILSALVPRSRHSPGPARHRAWSAYGDNSTLFIAAAGITDTVGPSRPPASRCGPAFSLCGSFVTTRSGRPARRPVERPEPGVALLSGRASEAARRALTEVSTTAAVERLVELDPAFAPVVELVDSCELGRRPPRRTHFAALARSICYQQLAGAAAATIHRRVLEALDGSMTAPNVLAVGTDRLRAAGLSAAKTAALVDLAEHCTSGRLRLASISRRSDDDVVRELVAVRGVGPWTAQMFLLFQLRRPDIWPVGDLGVQLGWAALHGQDRPTPAQLEDSGAPLRGIRSVAAWYCWRAVDAARAGELAQVSPDVERMR